MCVELKKLKRDAEKVKEDSLLKSIDGKGKMGYIEVIRWWKERRGVALQMYEERSKLDEKSEDILAKFTTLFRASPQEKEADRKQKKDCHKSEKSKNCSDSAQPINKFFKRMHPKPLTSHTTHTVCSSDEMCRRCRYSTRNYF